MWRRSISLSCILTRESGLLFRTRRVVLFIRWHMSAPHCVVVVFFRQMLVDRRLVQITRVLNLALINRCGYMRLVVVRQGRQADTSTASHSLVLGASACCSLVESVVHNKLVALSIHFFAHFGYLLLELPDIRFFFSQDLFDEILWRLWHMQTFWGGSRTLACWKQNACLGLFVEIYVVV